MKKRTRRLIFKVITFFQIFSLSLQPLSLLSLLVLDPVVARAENSVQAEIEVEQQDLNLSFDQEKNNLELRMETGRYENEDADLNLAYSLSYVDDESEEKIEQAVMGQLGEIEEDVYGADIYLGTCSGEDCNDDHFNKGSLQIGEDYQSDFILEDDEIWFKQNDGHKYITGSDVELGKKYVAPQNSDVTVTFSELPEKTSPLSIEEITLTEEEIQATGAVSDKAYDITTEMEDGSFKFDLTLPSTDETTEVVYVEERADILTGVRGVEQEVVKEQDVVKVKDLDHLTLFIPVNGVKLSVSGSFDGVSQVTVEPGETIEVDIIVERSYDNGDWETNDWESTSWRVDDGGWPCVNTDDHTGMGSTSSESFNITAPDTEGTYDVSFRAHRNGSCGDTGVSNTFTLTDGIIVNEPIPFRVCNDPEDDYSLNSSTGIWTEVDTDYPSNVTGEGTNEVRWGKIAGYEKSGLRFDAVAIQTFDENTHFLLGALTHMNWPIRYAADGAILEIALSFSEPELLLNPTFDFYFDIEETSNDGNCEYGHGADPDDCHDKITFPSSYGNTVITIDDIQYTLVIDGFVDSYACENIGSVLDYFITEEKKDNTAYLVGHLSSVLIEQPAISITKKTNDIDVSSAPGPELTVGDTVTWQYVIQNTGNVDLENISVVDNQGVTVDCGEQTTLASGASMTCTASDTATEGNYSNIATVTGTPPTGADVTDSDTSWYKGVLPPTGSIRIIKNAIPDNDQDFTFTSLNNSLGSFTLDDDGDDGNTYKNYIVFEDIPLGTHQITEDVPSGWSLSGISCVSNGEWAPNGSTLTVDVVPGEEVVCTFTNTLQTGTLKVVKSVDDDYPLSKFSFRLDGGSWIPAANGTGEVNFGQVTPGSHYIEESISGPGYIFKAVTGDSNCSYNENTHKIEAIVNAGQETVCYVENEYEKGQLEIIKDVVPNDSSQWDISINDFTETLGDSGSTGTVTLRRGQYTVTEEAHSGTNGNDYTSSYVCKEEILDDSGKPITQTVKSGFGSTFDIWVGRDDDIICTFTNTRNPYCGDGIINGQEECDYSELNGKSICSSECALVKECLPNMAANGGFEIPTVNDPLKWDIFTNAQVPGWTAEWYGASGGDNDPQIELHAGVNGWTSINNQYVELDSDWDGPGGGLNGEAASISIYQNIPVIKDYEYRVSWSYSPRPNHDNNRLEVKIGTDSIFDSGVMAGGGTVDWTDESYTFIPDLDDVVKISFTEKGNPDSYGMFLDNVSVECLGPAPVTIKAQKVVCDSEEYLPNWGNHGAVIGETTAQDYVDAHSDHCRLESQWQFQWAGSGAGSNGDFQKNTELLGGPWNTFTAADIVKIDDLSSLGGRIELREVFSYGPMVGFSNDPGSVGSSVSAEFYCTGDVYNYDNWEWINNPQPNTDYYCVAFNAYQRSDVTVCKLDEKNNYLSDWKVILRGTEPLENVTVAPDGGVYSSSDLAEGDYALIVQGTYEYRGGTGLLTDPGYSERLESDGYTGPYFPWINVMNLGTPGALGIMINGNPTNWGDYLSEDHRYGLGFVDHEDVFDFSVYDNNYSDNVGTMTVDIYEGYVGVTEENGCYTFEDVPFGTYQIDEIMMDGWRNVSGLDSVEIDASVEEFYVVNELDTYDVHGYKWSDLNEDGLKNPEEPLLPGWRIFIDENDNGQWDGEEQYMFTDDSVEHYGWYWFEDLLPGQYKICESNQGDWIQSFPKNEENNCHIVNLPDDNLNGYPVTTNYLEYPEPEYNFGNYLPESQLYIEKSNNVWPTDQSIGNEVIYTIRLMAVDGPVYDVSLFDLPPNAFSYVPGSYTANSSVRGDLITSIPEPTYASPGEWQLGDLAKDEIITLTYKAIIGDEADAGIYPDMAWAIGTSAQAQNLKEEGADLLALSDPDLEAPDGFYAEEGHYGEEHFVGTQVAIVLDETPADKYKVEKIEEVEGQVLGASTGLPATGARFWLSILALLSMLTGAGLLLLPNRSKSRGKALLVLLMLGLGLLMAKPVQALTSVRIGQPYNTSAELDQDAMTNQEDFRIDFVILDTDNLSLDAQCQQQQDGGVWVDIETVYTVKAGGNSGYCQAKDLADDSLYTFRVVASDGSETEISDTVKVGLETDRPEKPTNYDKDEIGSCEYEIEFKTADDGRTVRVEVYRSDDNESFTAKASSRIKTINIGPDEEYSFATTKPDCDKDYYYAIRAFDEYGNASDLVGDREIKTVIIEGTTGETEELTLGALPVTETVVLGEGEIGEGASTEETEAGALTEGLSAEELTEDEGGKILGVETESLMSFLSRVVLPILIVATVLFLVYRLFFAKRNEK